MNPCFLPQINHQIIAEDVAQFWESILSVFASHSPVCIFLVPSALLYIYYLAFFYAA